MKWNKKKKRKRVKDDKGRKVMAENVHVSKKKNGLAILWNG
jgi:hypothetical protein